jgi:hypothetical protein
MKNIIIGLTLGLLLLGCGAKTTENQNVEPQLVVGKVLGDVRLNDQFEAPHSLSPDTYKIVFAFSKDSAHTCNDFFKTQTPTYLQENHTEFIADVSAAPSLIRSLFITPGLKEFKHTVLLLEDKALAAPYKKGLDIEKIAVVYILNKKIVEIKTLTTSEELKKVIEDDSAMSYIAPIINKALN